MTEFSDKERLQAIITSALSAMTDDPDERIEAWKAEAAVLVHQDPNPRGLLAVLVGMTCGLIVDAALQREMDPADYWALACVRNAEVPDA